MSGVAGVKLTFAIGGECLVCDAGNPLLEHLLAATIATAFAIMVATIYRSEHEAPQHIMLHHELRPH